MRKLKKKYMETTHTQSALPGVQLGYVIFIWFEMLWHWKQLAGCVLFVMRMAHPFYFFEFCIFFFELSQLFFFFFAIFKSWLLYFEANMPHNCISLILLCTLMFSGCTFKTQYETNSYQKPSHQISNQGYQQIYFPPIGVAKAFF